MFDHFKFINPEFLWLILLIPLIIAVRYYYKIRSKPYLKLSHSVSLDTNRGFERYIVRLPYFLRIVGLIFLIIALARPIKESLQIKSKSNRGIDIVMAIDVSPSMLAKDLKPNRIEALKKVAERFIVERINDRIGIVVYSGESYTKTPITTDKTILAKSIREIKYSPVIESGTAIGVGLATSVNRLKNSKAKSKIIILLTDGENNTGIIAPVLAAEIAKEQNIKTYTVGVGTNGYANSPVSIRPDGSFVYQPQRVNIDENLLKNIAKKTGGKYFRATDNKTLVNIYEEINKLEKTDIEDIKYYTHKELFRVFLFIGFLLILSEIILRQTIFKSFI